MIPARKTGSSGSSGAGDSSVTTSSDATTIGSPVNFNAESYLYDVGLQNVFQDYQKNIATLNQQEQQSLQDAYYIREMSKKYLGEYASNVGVGDVSGNLLDIYGQYQQAVNTTRNQTNMAELGFQQQYDAQKRELETGKTIAEAQAQQSSIANWASVTAPNAIDLDGNRIANPNYNPNFNIEDYIDKPSGWKDGISEVFVDAEGNQKYIAFTIDEEGKQDGAFKEEDNFSVQNAFESQYPGKTAVAGDTVIYKGETFVLKEGSWYRLISFGENSPKSIIQNMQTQQNTWNADNLITDVNNIADADPGLYQDDGNPNRYIVNLDKNTKGFWFWENRKGLAYEVTTTSASSFAITDTTSEKSIAIVARFREIHPSQDGIKNTSVVEYQGKLYFHKDGKIYEMKRRTN
jgi:hypothetical protein